MRSQYISIYIFDYRKLQDYKIHKMLWKLFIEIVIFCIIIIDFSYAFNDSKHNDTYECKLGSKTPYRCVANYDDSSLKYAGIL